jgi:hypothetical protein
LFPGDKYVISTDAQGNSEPYLHQLGTQASKILPPTAQIRNKERIEGKKPCIKRIRQKTDIYKLVNIEKRET